MWTSIRTLLLLIIAAKITIGEHNSQYGCEARKFDNYSPEESKKRLGRIVDRIDEDNNGYLTLVELKNWITYTSRQYIENEVDRLWRRMNPNNHTGITWKTYEDTIYGYATDFGRNVISYKSLINRDRRRWAVADNDLDGSLTLEEFSAFLHSEDHPRMRDVVLKEMYDDLDLDNNGKISLDEYIVDLYQPSEPDEQEPVWVSHERKVFAKFLDHNGDGYLSEAEVRQWIAPEGFDSTEKEAKHLLFEADVNQDEQLTKTEVLDKYDIFAGSQITGYGEALTRRDEL
ncbi:calumenin-B-like [Drosophila pseudoobscura]|uniref:Reticulocalbin-3 n=1 Tax=Drosophila pseudoobscura pseudoobscura TaxID=46245 RepID=A0A6I8UZ13_DROPS|nr:calumenin-B [Drosophila pseudoobscura]